MQTILATTYAVAPNKGSEDGMGWNYLMQIANGNKVIAITRENNRACIEEYAKLNNSDALKHIQFEYFDLPKWMRFWKKGGRGALLYFWIWQRAIPRMVKQRNLKFDIAHNLNFHNDWTPSWLWKLDKPFVWGPIGHHNKIPFQFVRKYGLKQIVKNEITGFVKTLFWKYSSALKKTISRADFIYAMNNDVAKRIPISKKPHMVKPSVASEDFGYQLHISKPEGFRIISAGRFVALKGFDITINAFATFVKTLSVEKKDQVHLTLVGSGPEQARLRELVKKHQIQKHVTIVNWLERSELLKLMRLSSVFLFPSHEGAGMVVAEALSFGLPVICLDNTGPSGYVNNSCGKIISPTDYTSTVNSISNALEFYHNDTGALMEASMAARNQYLNLFTWDSRREWLQKIYKSVG